MHAANHLKSQPSSRSRISCVRTFVLITKLWQIVEKIALRRSPRQYHHTSPSPGFTCKAPKLMLHCVLHVSCDKIGWHNRSPEFDSACLSFKTCHCNLAHPCCTCLFSSALREWKGGIHTLVERWIGLKT